MGKRRLFVTAVLFFCMSPLALADEVISIDINNYGSDTVFTGEAAVPGVTAWVGYDGGWGVAVGSPRTSGLADMGKIKATTYAAQVWVADSGDHGYVTGAGDGLMDDGFIAVAGADPNLAFIGTDLFDTSPDFAYGGTFDLYVYGDSAGDFYLTDANDVVFASGSVTGTVSGFVEGENYVVFENIDIANPTSVRLVYTNELNGVQLVKRSSPKVIVNHNNTADPNDYTINAPDYDAAFDTNKRSGENTLYGPDTNEDEIFYIDTGEYMDYDIVVDAANEGKYNLYVDLGGENDLTLQIYLDGNLRGTVTANGGARSDGVPMNLLAGTHTVRWQATSGYANVDDLVFNYAGTVSFADCQEIQSYGLNPAGDLTGDCRVDLDDLAVVLADWAVCYDPEL